MNHTPLRRFDKRRLRRWLLLFFIALAVPTLVLIQQAYSQLKWASFHDYQQQAESLASRIDRRFKSLIATEESRSYTDYAFLVIAGDPAASFVQRSELSAYPVKSDIPGVIGYFQVDAAGSFSTPLLPGTGVEVSAYGVSADELRQRRALQHRMLNILTEKLPVASAGRQTPSTAAKAPTLSGRMQTPEDRRDFDEEMQSTVEDVEDDPDAHPLESVVAESEEQRISQAFFDHLEVDGKSEVDLGRAGTRKDAPGPARVGDLKLDDAFQQQMRQRQKESSVEKATDAGKKRTLRKESNLLPEPPRAGVDQAGRELSQSRVRIHAFESEVDRFEFHQLDSSHYVLFRKVWRNGSRTIQGVLIEQQPFLRGIVQPMFEESIISSMSDLVVAFQDEIAVSLSSRQSSEYLNSAERLRGTLLYRSRLSAPLGRMELIFSVASLPLGPGSGLVGWTSALLLLTLSGGLYLMYRLGARQIELTRQQQDFVSAVSHELKTPLTSIRMYSEMLRANWISDDKRHGYYDYIHDESERLSRLINSVLQLARMTRDELHIELQPVAVADLLESMRPRISSQVERAGYTMSIQCSNEDGQGVIQVDPDSFTQIMINLVDNAIKFSAEGGQQHVEISGRRHDDSAICFSVRDFGPGIAKDRKKKIFRLFYRADDELTRETSGTGIGLALVKRLADAMNGRVDVINRDPGAEFRVFFKAEFPGGV